MGSNISSQLTKITEAAVTELTTSFATANETTVENYQDVNIEGVEGDVNIDELSTNQRVQIDLKQSMEALSSNEARDKLSSKILQESKQLVSGINLGQLNYSNTNMEKMTNVIHRFSSSVSQTCAAVSKQKQAIMIKGVKGSLNMNKLIMTQISGITSECVQSAMLNNQSIKELENAFTQSSSQTTKGLDGLSLAIMGLVVLGLPVAAIGVGGHVIMSSMGPILLALGIGVISYGISFKTIKMEFKVFSGLYNVSNNVDMSDTFLVNGAISLEAVISAFTKSKAVAFDLDRCRRKVYFYNSDPGPMTDLKTQTLTPRPSLVVDNATISNGDLRYVKSSGQLFLRCNSEDILLTTLEKNKSYTYNHPNMTLDGKQVQFKLPNLTNVSGRKNTFVDKRIIAGGLLCLAVGLVLLIVKRNNHKSPKLK